MLLHYLRTALRNIYRHRMFAAINIFGLALSMSIGMLVMIRIQDAKGYDRFHPAAGRTYRLITDYTNPEGVGFRLASTPLTLGGILEKDLSVVDKTVRLYPA